jgi:hypothetical protein
MLDSITHPLYSLLSLPSVEDIPFLQDIRLVVDVSTDPTTSDNSENEILNSKSNSNKAGLIWLYLSYARPIKARRTTFMSQLSMNVGE